MPTRDDIFAAIGEKLETINGLTVKFGLLAIEEPLLPVLAYAPADVEHSRTSKTASETALEIGLRLVASDAWALEEWRPPVVAAMAEDPTFGGLSRRSELRRENYLFFDPVFPQNGVILRYSLFF